MAPFGADDLDRESNASEGTSDNEQEDRDDVDMDADADGDAEGDGEVEDDNEEEDEDQEDSQYSYGDNAKSSQSKPVASHASVFDSDYVNDSIMPSSAAPTSAPRHPVLLSSPSPTQSPLISNGVTWDIPKVRLESITASVYDIVPTIAAPHSTSINAITATPDLRWIFSGGADGYIRKFNWNDTANGKSMLTVAQRHPFVDSVTKAGVLMSYWENGEDASPNAPGASTDNSAISPVYSLASQHEGLWLLSGLESGGINLQSVRHDEGKQIACLRGHTSAVSVLNIAQDEQSVLSGSWDKTVLDWDLNSGKITRSFEGSGGQISALETRPLSTLPVPQVVDEALDATGTLFSDSAAGLRGGDDLSNDVEDVVKSDPEVNGDVASPADSLFGGNDADSLFGDDNVDVAPPGGNFGDDEDDEFSRAIATGIREQENELDQPVGSNVAEVDVVMGGPDEATNPLAMNGGTAGQTAPQKGPAASSETGHLPSEVKIGLPHCEDDQSIGNKAGTDLTQPPDIPVKADSIFLAASIDGSLRVWDKRQPNAVARMTPKNVPPWCMNATWSPDGNYIYAGRRNGTVDEYSLHKGLRNPERSFKLPNNSGAVSALRAMPNGRHLLCASFDILRLYDLQQKQIFKHATVPFLIVPGHRTGVVSQLYIDPSCRYLISIAGNRGWEGTNTEVLLGYEIGVPS